MISATLFRFIVPLLVIALVGQNAGAEDAASRKEPPRTTHVTLSGQTSRPLVKSGEHFELVLRVELDEGWHIYGIENVGIAVATQVELEKGPFELAGKLSGPAPNHAPPAGDDIPGYDYYEGTVEFRAPVRVSPSAAAGETALRGKLLYQECTEKSCLLPADQEFAVALTVVEGSATPPTGAVDTPPEEWPPVTVSPPEKQAGGLGNKGFFSFLGLAIAAGILTLLTPCVFPLVPVTISYFLKQATGDRRHTFQLCATYSLGILVSFTALGFLLSVFFSANAARKFAADPILNLVIGILFIVFAFSLFGAFELQLPDAVTRRFNFTGRRGYGGALFLGLTFAVTAFACTAPFASTVIFAAVQGDYFWSLLGLVTYSATMALPFFILGLFPSLLQNMPKSGGWLNAVKVVFGFFELAASFKFLANTDWQWGLHLLSRPLVLSIWVICSLFACLYLLNLFRLTHDSPNGEIGVTRMTFSLAFGALALYMATGLAGSDLPYIDGFLPPKARGARGSDTGSVPVPGTADLWREDLFTEDALAQAQKLGKPLVTGLTAFT